MKTKKVDYFEVLRSINKNPDASQREMAGKLGFSLGKLNYCLKELQNKGFVKIQNFQNKPNKISYLRYVITPKGIAERTKLTIDFMKRKIAEYDELKKRIRWKKVLNVGNSKDRKKSFFYLKMNFKLN